MRKTWRFWPSLALITLTLLSLPFCKPKLQPVPVGDVRVVGTMQGGVLQFLPGEKPDGDYLIVTRAFAIKLYDALAQNKELKLQLQALQLKK